MSNRKCNYCQFQDLRQQYKSHKVETRKIKSGDLKGWYRVFIDNYPQEIYYMSIGKQCDC